MEGWSKGDECMRQEGWSRGSFEFCSLLQSVSSTRTSHFSLGLVPRNPSHRKERAWASCCSRGLGDPRKLPGGPSERKFEKWRRGNLAFRCVVPFPPPPPPFVTYVRAFPPVPCPLCLVKPCQRASFSFPWRPGLAWTGLDSSFLGYFSFVAPKDGPKPPPLSPSPQRNTRPLIPRGAPKRTHPFFLFLLTHPLPTPSPPLSSTPTTHPHTEQPWPAWS